MAPVYHNGWNATAYMALHTLHDLEPLCLYEHQLHNTSKHMLHMQVSKHSP